MVITKDSAVAKIFKELLKAPKTQKATTISTSVEFFKEKGIVVNLDGDIQFIFIKDKTVDKSCSIQGSFIISAICSPLSDTDVTITFTDGAACVNGIEFPTSEISEDRLDSLNTSVAAPHITFTNEQLSKIEKDFDITLGNYFISPTMVDVMSFAVNEGNLYRFNSSSACWKISNVEADVDKVQLEQDYGHTTKIWTMPHKIFDFMKIANTTKVYFTDYNSILVDSNEFFLQFNCRNTKTTKFKSYLNYINSVPEKTIKFAPLFKAKKFFDKIVENSYQLEEDINTVIKFTSGKGFDITIDTGKISFDCSDISITKEFELNTSVIKYLLDNLSEDTTVADRDNGEMELIDGNSHYFIVNFNQD